MESSSEILQAVSLTRQVRHNDSFRSIVDDVSCSFKAGHIYSVIGPSGAGKSSLLRLLNRLDEPTGGQVLFHGRAYGDFSPCQLRRKVACLFQTPHLFEGTVKDNLLYATPDLDDDEMRLILKRAQVNEDLIISAVDSLSVGERQRVAIARILTLQPEVLLLDEPTSALDPANTEGIENLIRTLTDEGICTLIVSHNPAQALRLNGECMLMVSGRIAESGSAEQVINDPQSEAGMLYKERKLQ